jgi:hypothetical protein
MDSHDPSLVDPESSQEVAQDPHWASFAIPLAVPLILAMVGLVGLWLDAFT